MVIFVWVFVLVCVVLILICISFGWLVYVIGNWEGVVYFLGICMCVVIIGVFMVLGVCVVIVGVFLVGYLVKVY